MMKNNRKNRNRYTNTKQTFVDRLGETITLNYSESDTKIFINDIYIGVNLCPVSLEYTNISGKKIGTISTLGHIKNFFNNDLINKPNFVY
jgi:hypothetical protein